MYFIKANYAYTSTWKILGVIIDNNAKVPEDLPKKLSRDEVLKKFSTKLIDDASLYVEALRPGAFVVFSEKTTGGARATYASLSSAADAIIRGHVSQYWMLPKYRDWRNFESLRDEVTFYKKATALDVTWDQSSVVSQLSFDRQLNNAELVQQLRVKTERLSYTIPVFICEDRNSVKFMIDGESYTINHANSETMRKLACIASEIKKGRQ